MSKWYLPESEDISIESNGRCVDIFVCSNDHGAVYISLTREQIRDIYIGIEAMHERQSSSVIT